MNHTKDISLGRIVLNTQIDKIAWVLLASLAIPFFIHLVPIGLDGPVGSVLLPIFYAPLIAVMCYRFHVGLVSGLLAPFVNYLLTGMPAMSMAIQLSFELTLFVLVIKIMLGKFKNFVGNSVIAYALVKLVSCFVFGSDLLFSFSNALPGIGILFVINIMILRLRDKNSA